MNEYNGIIILDKPTGCYSHKCVSMARRALNMKKIGHTGTLDPSASGVLPLLAGNATRAADFLMLDDKRYIATVLLGTVTDTYDTDGTVTAARPVTVSETEVCSAAAEFTGEILQLPPMYSAISVGGERLYRLARRGMEIEREKRKITIHSIEVLDIKLPEVKISVHCSKGTYIRSLAYDIGERLGCGGCIKELRRTSCGCFTQENAVTVDELFAHAENNTLQSIIIPTDRIFSHLPRIDLNAKTANHVKNGVPVYYNAAQLDTTYRVYDENGVFIALSRGDICDERKCLRLVKGFYQ